MDVKMEAASKGAPIRASRVAALLVLLFVLLPALLLWLRAGFGLDRCGNVCWLEPDDAIKISPVGGSGGRLDHCDAWGCLGEARRLGVAAAEVVLDRVGGALGVRRKLWEELCLLRREGESKPASKPDED